MCGGRRYKPAQPNQINLLNLLLSYKGAFGVRLSAFGVRRSACGVRRSADASGSSKGVKKGSLCVKKNEKNSARARITFFWKIGLVTLEPLPCRASSVFARTLARLRVPFAHRRGGARHPALCSIHLREKFTPHIRDGHWSLRLGGVRSDAPHSAAYEVRIHKDQGARNGGLRTRFGAHALVNWCRRARLFAVHPTHACS